MPWPNQTLYCECDWRYRSAPIFVSRPCRRCGRLRPAIDREWILEGPAMMLSPDDVALLLGRDRAWVRRHVSVLPAVMLGRRSIRIRKVDLPEWEAFNEKLRRSEEPFDAARGRQETDGFVYLIQAVDGGPIKIGKADDPNTRLAALQLSSPVRLRILAQVRGGYLLERELHHRFRAYRLHGEWFREDAPGIRSCLRGRSKQADRK